MADVVMTSSVVLKITDAEWRLIMRALAAAAGVKITFKATDKILAEALNKQLLTQRRNVLKAQYELAEKTLAKVGADEGDVEVEVEVKYEVKNGEDVTS